MSKDFTSDGAFAKKGYHHGNLREALIEAARFLIVERGPQGFTLIEAARLVNVSPAAPYRHFKDRDALVAEVAKRAATAFDERMRRAAADAPIPSERFRALGAAYLAFAREEPGLYRALFDASVKIDDVQSTPPRDGAFGLLVEAITAVRSDHPSPMLGALAIWALSHGIASLTASSRWPASAPSPEEVLFEAGKHLIGPSATPPS